MSRSILGLGFLQKDDVGVGVSAQDTEILSIRGPVKRKNLLRGEICDLAASRDRQLAEPKCYPRHSREWGRLRSCHRR